MMPGIAEHLMLMMLYLGFWWDRYRLHTLAFLPGPIQKGYLARKANKEFCIFLTFRVNSQHALAKGRGELPACLWGEKEMPMMLGIAEHLMLMMLYLGFC